MNRIVIMVVALTCGGAAAEAQESSSPHNWEIEAHIGGAFVGTATRGSARLPTVVNSPESGFAPAAVSTWYIGDGAAFFNNISTLAGPGSLITPLDPVLNRAGTEYKRGVAFGLRVARAIDRRFSVEFSLDRSLAPVRLTDDARAGIEASSASFARAFGSLVFVNGAESNATIQGRGGARLSASGALNFNVLTGRRVTPYVTAGAGIVSTRGALPNATVVGRYQLPVESTASVIDGIDTVNIRYEEATSPILLVGGGFKVDLTGRSGIRGDVRFNIRSNHGRLVVDATPVQAGTSIGFLTGRAISGFETFTGTGHDIQTAVTFGYFTRF